MNHTTQMHHQNPNPNPNSQISHFNANNYSYQPPTADPHAASYPRPPAVDPPYAPPPSAVQYAQPPPVSYEPQQVVANAAAYYQDPNAAYYQDPNASWLAAITQFGATSYAAGVTTANPPIQPQRKSTWKKFPKKTTIVQPAWCEVCKIDCNSKDVLAQHQLGKKHKKNVEKLIAKITVVPHPPAILAPLPVSNSVPIDKPTIGPQENPEKYEGSNSQQKRKKAVNAQNEDLESKRKRVLDGGAAANAVRACHICNVVCNSDTVFSYHLAGQKHASMVKKYASMNGVASAM